MYGNRIRITSIKGRLVMRISVNQRGYTLNNLSTEELKTVMHLLGVIKRNCFRGDKTSDGAYYSGTGFYAFLNEDELKALHSFVNEFWHEHAKLLARLAETKQNREIPYKSRKTEDKP
jgi:hypothetical protein